MAWLVAYGPLHCWESPRSMYYVVLTEILWYADELLENLVGIP